MAMPVHLAFDCHRRKGEVFLLLLINNFGKMRSIIKHFAALATALLVSAQAMAYDFEVDGIYYNVVSMDDMTAEVTWHTESGSEYSQSLYTGDVVIPASVTFKGRTFEVIGIGDRAFNQSQIESVVIPESVVEIGNSAFYLSDLKEVKIPKSVTGIRGYAFYCCYNLREVEIGALNSIEEYASSG